MKDFLFLVLSSFELNQGERMRNFGEVLERYDFELR